MYCIYNILYNICPLQCRFGLFCKTNTYIVIYIYIVLFCDDPRFLNKQVGFVTVKAVKL